MSNSCISKGDVSTFKLGSSKRTVTIPTMHAVWPPSVSVYELNCRLFSCLFSVLLLLVLVVGTELINLRPKRLRKEENTVDAIPTVMFHMHYYEYIKCGFSKHSHMKMKHIRKGKNNRLIAYVL